MFGSRSLRLLDPLHRVALNPAPDRKTNMIAEGNFGRVCLPRYANMDVAVKEIANIADLLDELNIIARLQYYYHPNLVRCIGVCLDNSPYWIVMKKGGSSLRSSIEDPTQRERLKVLFVFLCFQSHF